MSMKDKKTVTRTETKTRVRPVTDTEEKVLRMSQGLGIDEDSPLEMKTSNPDLLAKLREIEADLFLRAQKIEPLSKKQQIIDKLRKR